MAVVAPLWGFLLKKKKVSSALESQLRSLFSILKTKNMKKKRKKKDEGHWQFLCVLPNNRWDIFSFLCYTILSSFPWVLQVNRRMSNNSLKNKYLSCHEAPKKLVSASFIIILFVPEIIDASQSDKLGRSVRCQHVLDAPWKPGDGLSHAGLRQQAHAHGRQRQTPAAVQNHWRRDGGERKTTKCVTFHSSSTLICLSRHKTWSRKC